MQLVAAPRRLNGGAIGINGPERRAANLVARWGSVGVNPIVCYPHYGRFWSHFENSGAKLIDFAVTNKLHLHKAMALRSYIRRNKAAVVHSQGPASLDFIACLASKLAGSRTIITRPVMINDMCTLSQRRRSLYQAIDTLTLRLANKVVTVSQIGRRQLLESQASIERKTQVVYNGVDLERFGALARNRGSGSGTVVIGMVAQLTPQKAWGAFIEVIHLLRQQGIDVRGIIVGDGPLRTDLEAQCATKGIADLVDFAGFNSDVCPFLKRMDIFLFTSLWEGLSVAVIEAMASGLPIVATNVGAAREQVDESNGSVVAPGDVENMVKACRELAQNPELRWKKGQASASKAQAMFAEDRMLTQYSNLYKELAAD